MRLVHVLSFAAALQMLSPAAAATDGGWSGFYVGATGALGYGDSHFALPGDTGDVLQTATANKRSFSGGALAGYDYRIGSMVIGVEGDVTAGGNTRSVTACNGKDGCFTPLHDSFTTYNHLQSNLNERLRARVGWISNNTLFYAAAGYSRADTRLALVGDCYNAADPAVPTIYTFDRSKAISGVNAAIGAERGLGDDLFLRAEFLYEDFGAQSYAGQAPEWNGRLISLKDTQLRVAIGYDL